MCFVKRKQNDKKRPALQKSKLFASWNGREELMYIGRQMTGNV